MTVTEPMAEDRAADLRPALEETRNRFLAAVKEMRPRLHRFCSRMCGSVLDGEDLVQETLAQAFYYLPSLKDQSRLEPWLFRIAHNKCVDFLRRERKQREDTVSYDEERGPESVPEGAEPVDEPVDDALAALVAALPPKERACVLLKDVLDYPLGEIAGIVDSTLGGVKAALHRGRALADRARPAAAGAAGGVRRVLQPAGLGRPSPPDPGRCPGRDRGHHGVLPVRRRGAVLRQLQRPALGVEVLPGAGGWRAAHRALAEGRGRLASAGGGPALVARGKGGPDSRLRARRIPAPACSHGGAFPVRAGRRLTEQSPAFARV